MHRVIDYCSDRLWIVVAMIILVVSSYVMLGRYLANSVHLYRADVVELINQRTGMHSEIAQLSGRWAYFTPVIELVRVGLYQNSSKNSPVISATKVVFEVDVLASLLVGEPRLVKLSVHGLDVSLERNAQGEYSVFGFDKKRSGGQGELDLLPMILRQDLLMLHDSTITVNLEDGNTLVISDLDLALKRFAGFYHLAASTEMSGQAFRLVTEINGNPLEWKTNDMDVYLRIGKGDLLRWLPKSLLENISKRSAIGLTQWRAGTEIWGRWEQGKLSSLRGFFENELLEFNYKGEDALVSLSQLNSQFQLDMDGNDNVQLQLQDFSFNVGKAVWPASGIKLNLNSEAGTADVQIEEGELASLSTLLLQTGILKTSMQEMLGELALKGRFRNTTIHLEKESEEIFDLSADLDSIYCKQWKYIPAVNNLSGQIQLKPASGIIQIESEQLGLASPHYFRQPLLVETLRGPVAWQTKENNIQVQSAHLIVSNADVQGEFVLGVKVPLRKKGMAQNQTDAEQGQGGSGEKENAKLIELEKTQGSDAELYITARFDNIVGQSLSLYLPPSLPNDVLQWLDTGLLGGQLNGRLLYHGSLNWRNPLSQHTLQTLLKFNNATVDYLPGEWPLLSQAKGSLFIDESNVSFVVEEGKIWDSNVKIPYGFVGKNSKLPMVHVSLDASYESPVQDALRLLNETPLKDVVGGSAKTWQGSGGVSGKMLLSIPLAKSDKEMALDVVADFQKAKLSLPEFDLVFSDLNGQLRYNNADGLYSNTMHASLFGYPAEINLPKFDSSDGTLFRLDLDSQITLKTLTSWSHQPVLSFMDGLIEYHGELSILNPSAVTTLLRISSDTEGMSMDLPAPFGKSKDQARNTLFQMLSQGESLYYYIRQDQVFDAYLKMDESKPETLRLVIGEEREISEGRAGVSISGQINRLNWDEWEHDLSLLVKRYDDLDEQAKKNVASPASAQQESPDFIDMITGINLQIEHFDGFGLQVESMETNSIRVGQSWWVNADSPTVKGLFKIPDDDSPIALDLDYFYIPEEDSTEDAKTVSAGEPVQVGVVEKSVLDMTPAEFPAVSVKIADLRVDGWDLGKWTFTGKPSGELYSIDDLKVELADQVLDAKAVWRPDGLQSVTEFKGVARGKNIGKLMSVWGHTPTIVSNSSLLNFDLYWPHSPLDFSFETVSGDANLKIKEGRFLDVGAASALRVLGILNFAEVGRRLRLDFGDLIKSGHSFNRIEGPMRFNRGILAFEKLKIQSPSSKIALSGDVNLVDDSLDMVMNVELEITKNLVAIAALVGGPAAGGGMFIIDRLIGDRLAKIAGLKYIVSGTLANPEIRLK
ncbi:MAG: TIGR02099 family protein [Pseudomonadales bacterium]|nr:TIGR02099 family protein [Pseudomonadales bacterium]